MTERAALLTVLLAVAALAHAEEPPVEEPPVEELPAVEEDPAIVRGRTLAGLAGCAACHTAEAADDGTEPVPYAGGHGVVTDFGTFYGSNLTPEPTHGLGAWTREDFARAMREGLSPDGTRYWPAFPYTSFHGLTDEDVDDLWAFLQSLPANATPDRPHETGRGRWQLRLWRPLVFGDREVFTSDPEQSVAWNRGAYLVNAVGHCGECHTPRGSIGGLKRRKHLGGAHEGPAAGPNLTPHPDALGGWSQSDWTTFFELGMTPSGDFVGGEMSRIVEEGTAPLSAEDREAMATYLMSLPPVRPKD